MLELLAGIAIGAAVAATLGVTRRVLIRRRRTARMVAELSALELPLLMVEYPRGRIRFSPALCEHLGVDPGWSGRVEEAIARWVAPDDQSPTRRLLEELRTGANAFREGEISVTFADGRLHRVAVQAFRMEATGYGAGLIAATVVDRTRAREIEEERDRLFNLSLDLLAVGDLNGQLLQVNPAWVRVLRWSRDDIMARTFVDLIHPQDRDRAREALQELRGGSPVRDLELRTLCRDGSFRWVSWSSFPLTARATVFTVARDMTERKAAEDQLQRYQQRLSRLANEVATLEERQNRRLAETLHDTLAQELFAVQAKLTLLKYPDRVTDPAAVLAEASAILDHASSLTRTLTFELFPPALYEVGLDAALEWLCRSFRKTRGLDCQIVCQGDPVDLVQDVRLLLYQGARELLGNVYKHAAAERAEVLLQYSPSHLVLTVDDDGRGFRREPSADGHGGGGAVSPDGFGLFNIGERVGQRDGTLAIGDSPLGGARVTITLPLPDGSG
jgi:PAS domain S-box-containing protein